MFLKKHYYLILSLSCLLTFLLHTNNTTSLNASLSLEAQQAFVVINGLNYGHIDDFSTIEQLARQQSQDETQKKAAYHRVTFTRTFVAERSLYGWAKTMSETRQQRQHIQIIVKNKHDEELARYALRLCKPLAWTLLEHAASTNGYQESIDLAVQSIHQL